MKRFIKGDCREQITLLPESLDDYIDEENPVRVIDVFVDQLDFQTLGFDGAQPAATGRPAYHPACSRSTYTAISIAFSRVVAWSVKRSGT